MFARCPEEFSAGIHHGLRRAPPPGDIFSGAPVRDTGFVHHVKSGAVSGRLMGKISVFRHILRFLLSQLRQLSVV